MTDQDSLDVEAALLRCEEVISKLRVVSVSTDTPASAGSDSSSQQKSKATILRDLVQKKQEVAQLLKEFYTACHDALVMVSNHPQGQTLQQWYEKHEFEQDPTILEHFASFPILPHLPSTFFRIVPSLREAHSLATLLGLEDLSTCIAAPLLTLALGVAFGQLASNPFLREAHTTGKITCEPECATDDINDTLIALSIIAPLLAPALNPEHGAPKTDATDAATESTEATEATKSAEATALPALPLWVPVALAQLFSMSALMQNIAVVTARDIIDKQIVPKVLAGESYPDPKERDVFPMSEFFFTQEPRRYWEYLPPAFVPTAGDIIEMRLTPEDAAPPLLPLPLPVLPSLDTPFHPTALPLSAETACAANARAREAAAVEAAAAAEAAAAKALQAEALPEDAVQENAVQEEAVPEKAVPEKAVKAKAKAVKGKAKAAQDKAVTGATPEGSSDTSEAAGATSEATSKPFEISRAQWASCPPAGLYLHALVSLVLVPAAITWSNGYNYSHAKLTPDQHELASRWTARVAYLVEAQVHSQLQRHLSSMAFTYIGWGVLLRERHHRGSWLQTTILQLRTTLTEALAPPAPAPAPAGKKDKAVKSKPASKALNEKALKKIRDEMLRLAAKMKLHHPTSSAMEAVGVTLAHLFSSLAASTAFAAEQPPPLQPLPAWPAAPLHALRNCADYPNTRADTSIVWQPPELVELTHLSAYDLSMLRHSALPHVSLDGAVWLSLAWTQAKAVLATSVIKHVMKTAYGVNVDQIFHVYTQVNAAARSPFKLVLPSARGSVLEIIQSTPPVEALQSSIATPILCVCNALSLVAAPLQSLPFSSAPAQLNRDALQKLYEPFAKPFTANTNSMPFTLLLYLYPDAGEWLLTEGVWRASNAHVNDYRGEVLSRVGHAHLMRGAWVSLEKHLHEKVMEPMFEHDAVVLRSLLGVMRLPSRDLSKELDPDLEPLPIFAVPRQLTTQLQEYCRGQLRFSGDEKLPSMIATVPLLGLAPTEAMVPPVMSLFCAEASEPMANFQHIWHLADAALHDLLKTPVRCEHIGSATVTDGVISSPLLAKTPSGHVVYHDPVLAALNGSFTASAQLSAALLRDALVSVGAHTLATANAPRLGPDERTLLGRLLGQTKPEDSILAQFADAVDDDIASIVSETDPLEAQRRRVRAHNTPTTPYRRYHAPVPPVCPRCRGAQVPALTFCVLRDPTELRKRREDMHLPPPPVPPKNPKAQAVPPSDDAFYFSYPAHTCLACYPASITAGESLRKILLVESGAMVSTVSEPQETTLLVESKPTKTKSGSGSSAAASTPTTETFRLALRMVNVSDRPNLLEHTFFAPLYGTPVSNWFIETFNHKHRFVDSPVDPVNALRQTMAARTTLDHFAHHRLAPTALSLVHFPAADMSYLPHARVRAAAVCRAQSLDIAFFRAMPRLYGTLHARTALAQLLLALPRPDTEARDEVASTALETMGGHTPEHTLVYLPADEAIADDRRLTAKCASSPFASCLLRECTCDKDVCMAHDLWKSGMNTLLRYAAQRDELTATLSRPNFTRELSTLVMLASSLRIVSGFLKAIAIKFPPVARASMVLLRSIGACNALIAALPESLFGPRVPARVSIDLLAESDTTIAMQDFYTVLPYVLQTLRAIHADNFPQPTKTEESLNAPSADEDSAHKSVLREEHGLCLVTLLHALPLLVLSRNLADDPKVIQMLILLRSCAPALLELDDKDKASCLHAMQEFRGALSSAVSFHPEIMSLWYVRDWLGVEPTKKEWASKQSQFETWSQTGLSVLKPCLDHACHADTFVRAMHAQQRLRLGLSAAVSPMALNCPINELRADGPDECHPKAVTCTVTPSLELNFACETPTVEHTRAAACNWLDHLRLLCCHESLDAAVITAMPTARPHSDAPRNRDSAMLAAATPIWTWLMRTRRSHAHTLARRYAAEGKMSVLLQRLPVEVRKRVSQTIDKSHTPPADLDERPAIEVPTLTDAPAPAQTWLQVSTALWSKVATANARDVATRLFSDTASDAASANATAKAGGGYASLRERRDWQLFAMFAYWAGKRDINVPTLLLEAVKATESWQGSFDSADFRFTHCATDLPSLYAPLTAPISAISPIEVPLPRADIDPLLVWQTVKSDGKAPKEVITKSDTAKPFSKDTALGKLYASVVHYLRDMEMKQKLTQQLLKSNGQLSSFDNDSLRKLFEQPGFADLGYGAELDAVAEADDALTQTKIELDSDDSDDSDDASAFKEATPYDDLD